jgi:hypothetical protein
MNIPLLILSFNQLTYLRNLINWFRYYYPNNDIYIIDNASSYPPLLEYLSDIHGKDNSYVFNFKFNEGSINLKNVIDKRIATNYEYYIISDPDIMPHMSTPTNFLNVFRHCIDDLGYHHVGFCLKIDDIPQNKVTTIEQSRPFWQEPIIVSYEGKNYTAYKAPIDTTFALYKSAEGWEYPMRNEWWNNSLRMFDAFHLPWYLNGNNINEEMVNYYNTASSSKCFNNYDPTQLIFQLQHMGFFNYLPDKIMDSFYDLSIIDKFYRFLSWGKQDLKAELFKALNGSLMCELEKKPIDTMNAAYEVLIKEFTETVLFFMKEFQIE